MIAGDYIYFWGVETLRQEVFTPQSKICFQNQYSKYDSWLQKTVLYQESIHFSDNENYRVWDTGPHNPQVPIKPILQIKIISDEIGLKIKWVDRENSYDANLLCKTPYRADIFPTLVSFTYRVLQTDYTYPPEQILRWKRKRKIDRLKNLTI